MADDGGVWAKIYPDPDSGAAKIGMSSVGVDNAPNGKPAGATDLSDGSYTYTDGGKTYRVLAFTDDGRGDLELDVETAGFADVLIVGGGAAGGAGYGSGGGAGAFISITDAYFSATTHTVLVGAGGIGNPILNGAANTNGNNGNASKIGDYFSAGGGGGTGGAADLTISYYPQPGLSGGSGGGASGANTGGTVSGGTGIVGLGNNGGGRTTGVNSCGAGGGGAGSVGVTPTVTGTGGDGGSGAVSTITGVYVTLCGGGGGGGASSGGAGGSNIGGAGVISQPGGAATVNTGSGGGGAHQTATGSIGGAGGSGIVIVRVEI